MFEIIMAHLTNVLLSDKADVHRSLLDELRSQHDAFLASRSNVYVHGEQYMKVLHQQLLSGDAAPRGNHALSVDSFSLLAISSKKKK